MEYESKPFDAQRVVDILAEIWGREHGVSVVVKLTPKAATDAKDVKVGFT